MYSDLEMTNCIVLLKDSKGSDITIDLGNMDCMSNMIKIRGKYEATKIICVLKECHLQRIVDHPCMSHS